MKILISFLFIVVSSIAFNQELECSKFKNGNFTYEDEKVGVTYIERNGSQQLEYGDQTGLKILFKVKWLDECTYTLKVKKVIENTDDLEIPEDMILTVEIIEIKENSYVQRTSSNKWDLVTEGELILNK